MSRIKMSSGVNEALLAYVLNALKKNYDENRGYSCGVRVDCPFFWDWQKIQDIVAPGRRTYLWKSKPRYLLRDVLNHEAKKSVDQARIRFVEKHGNRGNFYVWVPLKYRKPGISVAKLLGLPEQVIYDTDEFTIRANRVNKTMLVRVPSGWKVTVYN